MQHPFTPPLFELCFSGRSTSRHKKKQNAAVHLLVMDTVQFKDNKITKEKEDAQILD